MTLITCIVKLVLSNIGENGDSGNSLQLLKDLFYLGHSSTFNLINVYTYII